jgi:hypothetical protein
LETADKTTVMLSLPPFLVAGLIVGAMAWAHDTPKAKHAPLPTPLDLSTRDANPSKRLADLPRLNQR